MFFFEGSEYESSEESNLFDDFGGPMDDDSSITPGSITYYTHLTTLTCPINVNTQMLLYTLSKYKSNNNKKIVTFKL